MYTEFINPIYGTYEGLEAIAIGAFMSSWSKEYPYFLIVEGDGKVREVPSTKFVVDARFDGQRWQDVSPGPEDAEE